jgi:drug/metabolite transporter (DMT)-like permease
VISSAGIPAMEGASARFLFGSLSLLAVMLFRREWPRVSRDVALKLTAMGFFGVFLYNLCFFNGLRTVPAGRASLIASFQPSMVFLFSAIVWGERVSAMKIAGLVISLTGAMLVLSQGDFVRLFEAGLNTGDIWVLGCMLSWVAYTLLGRTVMGRVSAIAGTAYSTWLGTGLILGLALMEPPQPAVWTPGVWIASAFLGICGSALAFLLYLQSIGQVGASRASIFINLVPVFGVFFSAVLLRESIGFTMLAGGAIVIGGVRLLNRG